MKHTRIKRHLRNLIRNHYGFMPRITEYKGRIYISDPVRPSEPWQDFDSAEEALKHYLQDARENRKIDRDFNKLFN